MIRRLFERSLLTQVIVILLIVLFAFVGLMNILFQSNFAFSLNQRGLRENAAQIATLTTLVESSAPTQIDTILRTYSSARRYAGITGEFPDGAEHSDALRQLFEADDHARTVLSGREVRFRTLGSSQVAASDLRGNSGIGISVFEISVSLAGGKVLFVWLTPPAVMYNSNFGMLPVFIFLMFGVATVGVVLVRWAFRPLTLLEKSASRFGSTLEPQHIPEVGPSEVRQVSIALNDMQSRIQRLVSERAMMMAAIAHDVRTALTRLRLRLDSQHVVDPGVEEEIEQVNVLISDMMTFARSAQPSQDEPEVVQLDRWLTQYAEKCPHEVILCPPPADGITVALEERALRRALDNLVDNANRYAGAASLALTKTTAGLEIDVRDKGPGVSEQKMPALFTPFYRLEYSRNRDTGGSGLGLGIARELIRAQGGDITLRNAQGGGLVATIQLPASRRIDD